MSEVYTFYRGKVTPLRERELKPCPPPAVSPRAVTPLRERELKHGLTAGNKMILNVTPLRERELKLGRILALTHRIPSLPYGSVN